MLQPRLPIIMLTGDGNDEVLFASVRFGSVGFLEKPDPQADAKRLASERGAFQEWARGRLIKRVDDETWVSPTSRPGSEIIEELTQPNEKGQTPIHHVPR